VARQRSQFSARAPHRVGRYDQARLVAGLQRERHFPGILFSGWFGEPEAGSNRPGDGILLPGR
jgi:hypothetical protein